jgi:HNH endonuclease
LLASVFANDLPPWSASVRLAAVSHGQVRYGNETMTRKKAERLLGCSVEVRENPVCSGFYFCYADGIGVPGKTVELALEELVKTVYQVRSRAVFEKSAYRCDICGKLNGGNGLQAHHKKFRSHGGTHEAKNLGSRCAMCHERDHGAK